MGIAEDIKVARNFKSVMRVVQIGNTLREGLIARSDNRIALIFSSHINQRVAFFTEGAVATEGHFTIQSGTDPVYLDIRTHGDIVTKALNVIGSDAAQFFSWIEVYYDGP